EETLGREILSGSRTLTIDKQTVHVKATVTDTQSMSAHADQGQLMDWLKVIKGVGKVFLTHGDDEPRQALAQKIKKDLAIRDIHLPRMREEVIL
ncbi:MBL fold metallo-hydrolase, partial [Candidatus Gottesmanbacteria bacterium]|nr:MBL fold metallo-hydrolase [Candidatus Gottesmanbacteria bacterium]